jgi:hypothetical protein
MKKTLWKLAFASTLGIAALAKLASPTPAFAFTCQQICAAENSSCKLDCRFTPYPGCQTDCFHENQACLAAC